MNVMAGDRELFPLCLRVVLPAGLACDGMPTYTRFICSHNEDDDESMVPGKPVTLMTLQVIKLRLVRQPSL